MKLTKEQMDFLKPYEGRMETATKSNWASAVSQTELEGITQILNQVTGGNRRANANCASCILEILTDIGRIYFAQKEAESKPATQRVGKTTTKTAKVQGVAVKTKRKA